MTSLRYALAFLCLTLVACGQDNTEPVAEQSAGETYVSDRSYLVLDEELTQLKYDFNASAGKVRLLFLSGPTCGICLRGMADLNDAFLAASQNDERLVTFVVHVPTLGAKEEHVADTIPLLDGPRVHHYWEDTGIIGSHFEDVMDVDIYVWDFWAIYGPDALWEGTLPPKPDYYEHQLGGFLDRSGGFPKELLLDAERFANVTSGYLDQVDERRYSQGPQIDQSEAELLADGTVIPVVAQPRNAAVSQHIRNRGGYKNLKTIQAITKHGRWLANGKEWDLTIEMRRPRVLTKSVKLGDREIVSAVARNGDTVGGQLSSLGVPPDFEDVLHRTFEFDGQLVEWPDKGSELQMIGMHKLGDVLAWKLDLTQASGDRWHLYINSHGGALVKADLLGEDDEVLYTIVQSDVRETDGFKYPHRIEYRDKAGDLLAAEVFDTIEVQKEPFGISEATVTH
ncbi:MAG: hypothetical protein HKN35_10820 [Woeseia sp.]|nr:hypothetical protein [Woeseia sp.]